MAPPILLPADLAADAGVGLRLSEHLARLRAASVPPSAVCAGLLQMWGAEGALADAATELALAANRSGTGNAYHNPDHTRDVVVSWATLDRLSERLGLEKLTLEDRLAGLCAALAHDLWHDGTGNVVTHPESDGTTVRQRAPFRLEAISAAAASTILARHGASERSIRVVAAAVLATDTVDGYAALRANGASSPPVHPGLAILSDPSALRIATMLRDADLMLSAGLTALDHDHQSELLGRELGAPLDAAASEIFFTETVGGRFYSEAGQLFQPRLDALCALNRLRAAEGGADLLARTAERLMG